MKATPLEIPDVVMLEPVVHGDARGFFMESWNRKVFDAVVGHPVEFVQDNHSRSDKGVLRGLHFQAAPRSQGKLVRVVAGEVFDVAVDLRRSSGTFGHWVSAVLSAENHRQIWVPPGFAHGFLVLSGYADVLYKTTDYYAADSDRALRWDDPDIGIVWPLDVSPILSVKDARAPHLRDVEPFS